MRWGLPFAVAFTLSSAAAAETVRDPHASFSIDIDTTGMCVVVPAGHTSDPACAAFDDPADRAMFRAATRPDTDLFAISRGPSASTFTTMAVVRIPGSESEPTAEDVSQFATLAFNGLQDAGPLGNSSPVATGQFRLGGILVTTFSQDADRTTGATPMRVRMATYVSSRSRRSSSSEDGLRRDG